MLDVLAARLPPFRPLAPTERGAIEGPLALVVYKHGGELGPEWQLTIAVGMVALGRYIEVKAGPLPAPPAGPPPGVTSKLAADGRG